MIVRARMPFGVAAPAHIVAVHDESFFERRGRHAEGVAGFAGAFQAVDQNHFASRLSVRMLHAHQHAHAGLGFIVNVAHGPATFELRPFPEIARNGGEVRVPKEGTKRARMERAHRSLSVYAFSLRVSVYG